MTEQAEVDELMARKAALQLAGAADRLEAVDDLKLVLQRLGVFSMLKDHRWGCNEFDGDE